jgi:tripartite-type tricarboxylate transporter receptor subunit TctC
MKKLLVLLLLVAMTVTSVGCAPKQEAAPTNSESTNTESTSEAVTEDSFPNKPIEVIVAYKAGGGTDRGARVLSSEAEKMLDQPLVIINKPGADGELGFTELANAEPDGYTIGFINLPTFVSLTLNRETGYEVAGVEPILNYVYDPGVLVVQGDSEWQTLEDFVDYAKANPEKITISNNGTGASNHIGAAHLEYEAGIKVTHVPFGGSSDMLAALRGGHVNATVAKLSEVAQLHESGDLRILASFTDAPLENFSDVPTLEDKGYKIYFGSARAIVAPAGTPKEIITKLHDMLKEVIDTPEHMEAAANVDLSIQYMSPDELKDFMVKTEEYLKDVSTKLDY